MKRLKNLNRTINPRLFPILLATAFPLAAAGCTSEPAPDGERPAIVVPQTGGRVSDSPPVEAPRGTDRVLADVSGVKVTESQVLPTLYSSYGLEVLLKVTQLTMAKAEAAREGLTVSQADLDAERKITMELAFAEQDPGDYDELLRQMLAREHVSMPEFEIVMETNAYLRALTRQTAAQGMTEEMVREEFNSLYGERVRVRHIALSNLQEVAEAKRRLAEGVPFEQVARDMSKFPTTARLAGALPPFSRSTANVSPAFAAAAFALSVGQVSDDAVKDGNFFHIIKLEERLAPRVQKFEDVRETVRQGLLRRREQAIMAARRTEMANRARRDLVILEPSLKKQFEERLKQANPAIPTNRDEQNARLDAIREKLNATTEPSTTQPAAGEPAATPTTVSAP